MRLLHQEPIAPTGGSSPAFFARCVKNPAGEDCAALRGLGADGHPERVWTSCALGEESNAHPTTFMLNVSSTTAR